MSEIMGKASAVKESKCWQVGTGGVRHVLFCWSIFCDPTRGADFMPNRSKNKELSVRAHSVCTFVAKPGILSYDFSYVLITFFLVYSSDQCPSKRSMRERLYTITSEYTLDKRQDSKD